MVGQLDHTTDLGSSDLSRTKYSMDIHKRGIIDLGNVRVDATPAKLVGPMLSPRLEWRRSRLAAEAKLPLRRVRVAHWVSLLL